MNIIGRLEYASLPELNLEGLNAKVDTGAYTSSVHCINVVEMGDKIECEFIDEDGLTSKKVSFGDYTIRKVKSSNGITENRFAVFSKIILGGVTYKIEMTLTDRSDMKYPILLGRKFLRKKFLVDVGLKYNLS